LQSARTDGLALGRQSTDRDRIQRAVAKSNFTWLNFANKQNQVGFVDLDQFSRARINGSLSSGRVEQDDIDL
jgi:hypothetical protein